MYTVATEWTPVGTTVLPHMVRTAVPYKEHPSSVVMGKYEREIVEWLEANVGRGMMNRRELFEKDYMWHAVLTDDLRMENNVICDFYFREQSDAALFKLKFGNLGAPVV